MRVLVPLLLISLARADDFFWPEDEAEELDNEVDFPGSMQETGSPAAPPKRTKESTPREPFSFKLFDHAKLKWRDPAHEEELQGVMKEQLSESWKAAVHTFGDEITSKKANKSVQDAHMLKNLRADKLLSFFTKYVNPTEEPLTGEEEVLISERVAALRLHEGLTNDQMPLAFGYLTRGYPRRVLDQLMVDLRAMRATRGERELEEEIAANRERPLLERRAAEKAAAEQRARDKAAAAERAAADKLDEEDRQAMMKRLAEKAAARMRRAETKL